ncbi:hypothetical protein BKA56DRAFT_625854 [Ilyonectria sp. MPI-CAGE-AT-0026]|nr:hypothetical protein BKA56DRAFT_625854 [Ilyonectria sp. MPI-CAGE-AT-0026]
MSTGECTRLFQAVSSPSVREKSIDPAAMSAARRTSCSPLCCSLPTSLFSWGENMYSCIRSNWPVDSRRLSRAGLIRRGMMACRPVTSFMSPSRRRSPGDSYLRPQAYAPPLHRSQCRSRRSDDDQARALLLEKGADIESKDEDGRTPL